MEAKTYKPADIKEYLAKSDHGVERGLVALYKRQTSSEQLADQTCFDNGIGFSAAHAEFGSILARWVMSGKHLSPKQMKYGRRIAMHYSAQLAKIANGKVPETKV